MAEISRRQALTHRQVALVSSIMFWLLAIITNIFSKANNRKAGVEGFEEVPFPNGTYPSETLTVSQPLVCLLGVSINVRRMMLCLHL